MTSIHVIEVDSPKRIVAMPTMQILIKTTGRLPIISKSLESASGQPKDTKPFLPESVAQKKILASSAREKALSYYQLK
jgi:hypothetical protein